VIRWVVAGAGSAGIVAASRLAEHPDHEVVLLESGTAAPASVDGSSFFDTLTEPGRTFDGLTAVRVDGQMAGPYRRGRGLGGSGSVNAMVALRGGPFDVDHQLHTELAEVAELGAVDRALLDAAPDAARVPLTRRDGRRVTAADCYDLADVDVRGGAHVDRVVLDGHRAVGVRLGDGAEIEADRVVISAGAIHSPAVLLRSQIDVSGIGVGLKDHPSAPITLALRPDATADPSSLAVGTLLQRGPIQVLPLNHVGRTAAGYGLLMPALMRVRSEGSVTLVSDDAEVHPDVAFRMLSHPDDLRGMVDAVEVALEVLRTPAFARILDAVYVDDLGTGIEALGSRDQIADWLPNHVGDYVHASCTCRMGVVVDDHCRVFGYDGLYVCDASVFPDIPEVNTHIPTVMLAETMAARWLTPSS
jgi:choline dehydrogenase-like flavoprotein